VRGDDTPMPVVLFILSIIIIGAFLFAAVVVVSVGSMSLMSANAQRPWASWNELGALSEQRVS
jgi:hypothetical protein